MRFDLVSGVLACCLIVQPVCAAPQPEQAVSWAELRSAITSQKLADRMVKIRLASGEEIKSRLQRVDDDAVVVVSTRKTDKLWKSTNQEARIPRAEVAGVEFQGRRGKNGLIGGLAGLGAGVGLAALALANSEAEGVMALAGVLLIPIGAIGGYLIGGATNEPLPHFRIVP
ncbi:MAG: hypothetical protein IPP47_04830 [Bryobacterales bacterium]|nr:hypothetical protein [Bryobacterales bacterium]